MIITISGTAGSGKSTVAKILVEKLNFKRYYMGQIARDLAKRHNMTLEEFLKKSETDKSIDKEIDDYQIKLGKTEDNIIVEGRTSFHFIPNSLKIFIKVSDDEGARRILKDLINNNTNRNQIVVSTIEEMKEMNKKRLDSDYKRYMEYYGFDPYDESNFDLVIDSTKLTPNEVCEIILKKVKEWN